MATKTQRIRTAALEILKNHHSGIKYQDLIREIHDELPDCGENTIAGKMWNLDKIYPQKVEKPARGLFRLIQSTTRDEESVSPVVKIKEEQFYQPFADWLAGALGECTEAYALGGNRLRDKWGTPDVIGLRQPSRLIGDHFLTEIVSAEIKTESASTALITAFGQACAYQAFSHKVYLVVPERSSEENLQRLDVLCRIFGIGLITCDFAAEGTRFSIMVRAAKHEPDMLYVDKSLQCIEDVLGLRPIGYETRQNRKARRTSALR